MNVAVRWILENFGGVEVYEAVSGTQLKLHFEIESGRKDPILIRRKVRSIPHLEFPLKY